jgi:hypothetical protein
LTLHDNVNSDRVTLAGADRRVASLGCVPFETALEQWLAGLRRLADADPLERPVLERVTRRVEDELRRRLGGPFTTDELVDFYDRGTGWITDLAVSTAPDDPWAWDVRVVGDAAFGRYVREASDYAGGRRLEDWESA